MDTALQILAYTIPSLIVFLITFFMVKAFFDKEYKLRLLEFREQQIRQSLPVRLQAYERLILFMERISLNNLLPRVRQSEMTVAQFRAALISNVNMEYEHNLSQQLYISPKTWEVVKAAKEEMKSIINRNAMELRPDASSIDLSKHIINKMAEQEEDTATQKAILSLKQEVMMLYER
ncbi:MAG TPA: hypothetical protein DHW15_07760 [Bacteroidetes bacterium]|jgi:hypothetical protein|nr:MAG: hypothetical protein ABR94_11520 [Sphingobacteriales bacterium BACL12 MAG-120802-bin5]KRP13862.1 MAG: hypothetical protein ABR95_02340 [Sphingobacteriales bacterium BACL12 MAG-120813-bin55]HCK22043.1 hypothetical protein [Bacteroidota bacterium]